MVLPAAAFLMNLSPKPGEFCEMPKRITNYNPERKRLVGRPKARWSDDVNIDLRNAVTGNWRVDGKDRDGWQGIPEEAKAHLGL